MKKYLMIGLAALAFASCAKHDFETMTQEQIVKAEYKANFVQQFGQPASNQTWGFGSTRAFTRANVTYGYNETSDGINANANEWADIKNSTGFGGWIVPDPLTPDQKALVARYFQTVTDLTYDDPHWSDFFVQQVYKGGNTTVYNTTEGIIAADGSSAYTSDNMNLLTVGSDPEHHINNFNGGSYGVEAGSGYGTEGATGVSVLDNGSDILAGETTYHNDQIMLMVNIEDTHCMGYHCSATGVSAQRNDKAVLVSWRTIAEWAVKNGLEESVEKSCLNDTWDRSFVGFDLALKPFDECVVKDESGNVQYAALSNISACPDYIWDGEKVMKIGTGSSGGSQKNITNDFSAQSWDNATVSYDGGILTVTAGQYGGSMWTSNYGQENWNSYTKLVIELAEATPADMTVKINGMNTSGATLDVFQYSITAGASGKIEIDITGNDLGKVNQVGFSLAEGTFKFSKIYLEGSEAYEYYGNTLLVKDANGNDMQIPFLARNTNQYAGESVTLSDTDLIVEKEGRSCVNLKKIQQLVNDGYYPTSSDLKEWSTWEDGDGYYSDWIVTLHKAERVPVTNIDYQGRIMVEDLSARADVTGKNSDWDFNDVVFDWAIVDGKAYIKLLAAGGTLPIRIGGTRDDNVSEPANSVEIHSSDKGLGGYMVNTGVNVGPKYKEFVLEDHDYSVSGAKGILITVQKGGDWVEIEAEQGEPAAKFNCKVGTKWCDEYVNITRVYPDFTTWVADPSVDWTQGDGSTSVLTDGNLNNND